MTTEQEVTQLVEENLGLVRRLVHRTLWLFPRLPGGYEREDVHSLGHLGLVRAAQSFDPARGVLFSTYAYRCIEHTISAALRREGAKEIECVSFTGLVRDEDETSFEDQVVDPEADTAGSVLQRCSREILAREIAQLPEQHAQLLQALYFQGNSINQMAVAWNRSGRAVDEIRQRALKALRRRLNGLGFQ